MAGVAKWLRPRIVVPIRVGSNPTSRPIKEMMTSVVISFIMRGEDENPPFVEFEREAAEAGVFCKKRSFAAKYGIAV